MFNEFIFHYLLLLAVILIAFSIGSILQYIFAKRNVFQLTNRNLFFRLILGTIGIITSYAFLRTGGVTINFLFILLGLFYVFRKRDDETIEELANEKLLNKTSVFYLILGTFLIYSWNYIYMYEWDGRFGLPFRDYTFYAILSYYIDYSGVENILYNNYMMDNSFKGVAYHHFFEMWFTAFVGKFFNQNYALSMQLTTFPFFQVIGFVGITEIYRLYNKNFSFLAFIFCFLMLFIGCVSLPFYSEINFLKSGGEFLGNHMADFYRIKFAYQYFFFIATFILFVDKKYFEAFLILLCIPISSFTTFPGIVMSLMALFAFKFFFDGDFNKKYIFYLIAFLICFVGFYVLFEENKIEEGAVSYYDTGYAVKLLALDAKSIMIRFNIFVKTHLQYIIYYLPLLLIGLLKKQALIEFVQERLNLMILVYLGFISGLIGWCLIFKDHNSVQLFITLAIPLNILFIYLIIHVFSKTKGLSRMFVVSMVVFFAGLHIFQGYQQYIENNTLSVSSEYLEEINQFLENENTAKPILGGSIKHPREFTKLRHTSYLKVKGYYLPYIRNGLVPFRLTNSEFNLVKVEGELEKALLERYALGSTFNQFVVNGQKEGICKDEEECQVTFIKKYKLRYLVVSKGVELSQQLQQLVSRIIVDEHSGDSFYILKRF